MYAREKGSNLPKAVLSGLAEVVFDCSAAPDGLTWRGGWLGLPRRMA